MIYLLLPIAAIITVNKDFHINFISAFRHEFDNWNLPTVFNWQSDELCEIVSCK